MPDLTDEISEYTIIRKNRIEITTEIRVVETEWEGVEAYLISLRDITQRKRAEEEITYQANLLRDVSDAIISTDLIYTFYLI